MELNCTMYWMVIYPVDSTIHLLNNWGLMDNAIHRLKSLCPVDSAIGFPNTYPLDSDLSDGYM